MFFCADERGTVSRRKVLFFYIFSPELKNAAKIWVRGFAADQKDFSGMRGERGEFGRGMSRLVKNAGRAKSCPLPPGAKAIRLV